MTLRARLTIFYTTLVGVVVILFGIGVYAQVSAILEQQVDNKLESAAFDTLQLLRVDDITGQLSLTSLISYDPSLTIQLWNVHRRIVDVAQAIDSMEPSTTPLDVEGLDDALDNQLRTLREVQHHDTIERVLTLPLVTAEGELTGAIQVSTNMGEIISILNNLSRALFLAGIFALVLAALGGWLSTRRALQPLSTMTNTAAEITKADDLSRRIPQSDAEDEIGQLISTFNQTLERLEVLFNLQRRFMADVGHELRTPLTVIKGNAEVMRQEGKLDLELLHLMDKEIDRLTRMVSDLLLLAQAESGKLPLQDQIVELDTITLEVLQEAHMLAAGRKEVNIDEIDQVLVRGDRDRLKQVLLNLVGNAVSYTQDGGKINLRLCKQNGQARFSVSDNGPGIAPDDLEHIFERFYRGEKSRARSEHSKGYGLGLSIAYWIVNNHAGKIEVESKLGEGTTFHVWLPLLESGR